MLEIRNLKVKVEEKEILKGLNLSIKKGEIHAIMGPNGSGKSTLASTLAGNPKFEVVSGEVLMNGENILNIPAEERSWKGLFLAFQYPVEIPGVSIINFMKTAINEKRKYQGLPEMPAAEFIALMNEKKKIVELTDKLSNRPVNVGFSGGEKKKNEVFQMAMLEPLMAVLDETDSGLDIDALRIVANGVNKLKTKENAFLLITHYQRLLDYIVPDFVHILYNGQIIKSGDKTLAYKLEKEGYDWVIKEYENR